MSNHAITLFPWGAPLSVFESGIKSLSSSANISKFPKFNKFYESHCKSRTYSFQIKKCSDPLCLYHKPLRTNESIADFPDPVPYEDEEGNHHYKEGTDPEEKYLPSKIQDVSKQPHKIPFPPTAQTAKNVGSVVKCAESIKPRLMFAQKSSKENEKKSLKRALNGMGFICGTSFQEFVMDTKN